MTPSTKIGCPICKHKQYDGTCTAFPAGIPLRYEIGAAIHTEPAPDQDNDLVFEWASPEEQLEKQLKARAKREASVTTI
jgi:hypothetical protein